MRTIVNRLWHFLRASLVPSRQACLLLCNCRLLCLLPAASVRNLREAGETDLGEIDHRESVL